MSKLKLAGNIGECVTGTVPDAISSGSDLYAVTIG